MATESQSEIISLEDYEFGKIGCCPLDELEDDALYRLRTKELGYENQALSLGSFATDITVRVIGKNCNPKSAEVAYEAYGNRSGEAIGVDIKSADLEGLIYKNEASKCRGDDVGYFLAADETLGLEDGRLVVRLLEPLRQKKAVQLKSMELPRE